MALGWLRKILRRSPAPAPVAPPSQPRRLTQGVREPGWVSVREALEKPGVGGSIPGDSDFGYRRVTGEDDRRDLSPVRWDYQLRLANWLWASHPVAKKCIQNTRNFICGTGFRIQALSENEAIRNKVQGLLEKWWALNDWDTELSRRVESLSVEGEWVYYCPQPNPYTGHWRMCKILPENVKGITRDRLNAEQLDTVQLSEPIVTWHSGERRELEHLSILRVCCHTEKLVGNCLHLGINRLSAQTRGFSDLLAVADHLDLFDTVLFTEAERIQIQRAIVYDVTLKGTSGDKLTARKNELEQKGPPRPGALNAHTEDEQWQILAPSLNIGEAIEFCRFLLSLSLGGLHTPEHWFAEGGDVNKATSDNMGGPAFAQIRERKREIVAFQSRAAQLALQRYQEVGVLSPDLTADDLAFQIVSRDPEQSAYQAIGAVLQAVGQGLQIGQVQGWFTAAEAARAYRQAASHLGLGEFPGVPTAETLDAARQQVANQMAATPELKTTRPLALVPGGN